MCSLALCMTKRPLRRANRCIVADRYRGLKETTGLVGLEVDPEARSNVLAASQQVLAAVAEKIPKEAQYRANVEATMEHWIEKVWFREHAHHTHVHGSQWQLVKGPCSALGCC
jgi:ETC complex I subunit conserved region